MFLLVYEFYVVVFGDMLDEVVFLFFVYVFVDNRDCVVKFFVGLNWRCWVGFGEFMSVEVWLWCIEVRFDDDCFVEV